ncbi:MAG: metallophosphoesterase [Prevotella sp.]|nr:metallophosphoesterase [Prevotella sp.]
MKILSTLLAFLCTSLITFGQNQPGKPWQVRLLNYNVHHCADINGQLNDEATANAILQSTADVVTLQELDSMTTRSNQQDQLRELASKTLYYPTFASAINFDGGTYGVGILTRERPLSVKRIPLPGAEPRVLLVVELKNCVVACTHLDLQEEHQLASVPIIVAEAQRWEKPFLIAGDCNAQPDSKTMQELTKHFTLNSSTRPTFPADNPKQCIDYIASYKSRQVVTLNYRVMNESKASDHHPIVADLRLPLKAEQLMTTKPYLQDPQPTQMTVMFQTTAPAHCWIEYGTDKNNLLKKRALLDGQEICFDIENRITLNGLQPGQQYYYRVCVADLLMKHGYEFHVGDTLRTPFYSFRTPSDAAQDFTCVVFNDLHAYDVTYQFLCDTLRATGIHPDFIIFNGDCLTEPFDREHAIRLIHNLTDPINGAEIPIFFIRGNHEIRNYYSAGMHSLIGYPNDKTYGSINWGDTRFMILDCGEDKPDDHIEYGGFNDFTQLRLEETDYILQELKSKKFKKAKRRILISHIPIFGNGDDYQPCRDAWAPLLGKAPFDLVLCAHIHHFRFTPKGLDGATFPVQSGGAPDLQHATVSILQKNGNRLHLKVLGKKQENCIEVDL